MRLSTHLRPLAGLRALVCLTASLLFGGTSAWAQQAEAEQGWWQDVFSFSGYGTVGFAHSSEDQADFLGNDLQERGAGYSRSWSPHVDSRLAGQLTARFRPDLTGVVQVIAQQGYDGSYRPKVEWANIKYDVNSDFSIRVGRVVLPSFLASDHRLVGYAYPWVRPPTEVYGLVPLTNSDGIDFSYRFGSGDVRNTIQAGFGKTSARVPDGGKARSEEGWSLTDTVEVGALTLRGTYARSRFTLEPFAELFNGYRALGASPMLPAATRAQANAIANRYDPNDKPVSLVTFGASYDPGKWFVMSEWSQFDTRSVLGKRDAWYVSGGVRIGSFTPYVVYAKSRLKSNLTDPGVTNSPFFPAIVQGTIAGLNSALNFNLGAAAIQETVTVGTRWDFARNAALKVQLEHGSIGSGSPGVLNNEQAGFRRGGSVDVLSIAVDFVF